jgi:hypothetical protein
MKFCYILLNFSKILPDSCHFEDGVIGAGILPIGLQIQTNLFQSDLKLISQTTVESNDIDIFISSGGNDVFDVFDVLNNVTLLKAILTPTDRDDQRLPGNFAGKTRDLLS